MAFRNLDFDTVMCKSIVNVRSLTTNCRRYVGARPLMDFTIREHPWLQSFELIEAWQYVPYLSLLKPKNKAEN